MGGPPAAVVLVFEFVFALAFMFIFITGLGGATGFLPVPEPPTDGVCHCALSCFTPIVDARAGSGGWKSPSLYLALSNPLPEVSVEGSDDVEAGEVDNRCAGFFATGGAGFPALSCCDSCDV